MSAASTICKPVAHSAATVAVDVTSNNAERARAVPEAGQTRGTIRVRTTSGAFTWIPGTDASAGSVARAQGLFVTGPLVAGT